MRWLISAALVGVGIVMAVVMWWLLATWGWWSIFGFLIGALGVALVWVEYQRHRFRTVTVSFPCFTEADLGSVTMIAGEQCRVVAVRSSTSVVVERVR